MTNDTNTTSAEDLSDPDLPVSRAELFSVVQGVNSAINGITDQMNTVIQQLLQNQAVLAKRLDDLSDPSKPRIILPQ